MKQRVPIDRRSPQLRGHHRRAFAYALRGLNSKGQPFKRHPNCKSEAERRQMQQARNLKNWRARAKAQKIYALNTRGTRAKYKNALNEVRMLMAEIDALAGSLAAAFEHLSPLMQAQALQLATHLAAIKRRLA